MSKSERISSILEKARKKDQEAIKKGCKEECEQVFKENAELLKNIIKRYGWPYKTEYNERTEFNAWIIAQHSDHDTIFQLQCLALILNNTTTDKEIKQDIVYLIDRIIINMGGEQVYGTQVGKQVISPKQLDQLRQKAKLEPIQDYINREKN